MICCFSSCSWLFHSCTRNVTNASEGLKNLSLKTNNNHLTVQYSLEEPNVSSFETIKQRRHKFIKHLHQCLLKAWLPMPTRFSTIIKNFRKLLITPQASSSSYLIQWCRSQNWLRIAESISIYGDVMSWFEKTCQDFLF